MNKGLLLLTRRNLYSWLTQCNEVTVPDSKKLTVIMMSLADMCSALARDTEDEVVPGCEDIS